jgi:transglutaminase-like putative cysteine protease
MLAAVLAQPVDINNSGASLLFTSSHPVAIQIRGLMEQGSLGKAEKLLGDTQEESDSELDPLLTEAADIIRRLRREYALDLSDLMIKLKDLIPNITADDIQRWREAGQLQWRLIDGQVCYFRREPANLFRFCEEAKRRGDEHAGRQAKQDQSNNKPSPRQRLLEHLNEIVTAAERNGQNQVLPLRHRICYRLTVRPNRPFVKAGSLVRCWLPFPQQYRQQKDIRLIRTKPTRHVVAPVFVDSVVPGGASQRTVYLEQRIHDPAKPMVFKEEFEYISFAYYPTINDADARSLSANYNKAYLKERPPHIVFTPEIREAVKEAIGLETNPLVKARKIFRFVANNIGYCSEEEYSVIPSFSTKALTTCKGDCGIQSMLFITMCRAAGIPARWQSGYQTRPDAWNMHDWAEFYVEPWGWLPADVSYGFKESDDPRIREFYFGHLDSYRLIVNMDYGSPLQPAKMSLRSEPADFQRGEVEVDGRNLYFDEWDWDFQLDVEPVPDKQVSPSFF